MRQVDIHETGPHEYMVVTPAGTRHRVRVPEALRVDLGIVAGADEERLVEESFAFLLEREPARSILGEFDLDVIARYFPEYPAEIRARLSGQR